MSIQREPSSNGEIRALTGLRTLAATWVVCLHFSNNPGNTWMPYLAPIRPLIANGWLGVDLFFVLSGFVLTYNYLGKIGRKPGVRSAAGFYWNRISRVWPTWAFVLLAFSGWLVIKKLTVGGPHVHDIAQPRLDLPHLVEQLFMVQMWHRPRLTGVTIVGPGWSLSAEWLAYVSFPVLVLVLYRLRRLPAAVLGALAVLPVVPFAYIAGVDGMHDYAWSWLLRIAGGFVAGSLIALCVRRIQPTERVRRNASIVAAAALVWIVLSVYWSWNSGGDFGGVAVLGFPVLVGGLAFADRGPARFLSTDWMVTGGRMSYALYLVHLCVFELWWTAMDNVPHLQPGSRFAELLAPVVLVVPFFAAYALWRYVEEPVRIWMRRFAPAPTKPRKPVHRAASATTSATTPATGPAATAQPESQGLPAGQDAVRTTSLESSLVNR